ncbi:hypothetical protein MtrunA17_Chr7g0255381 [Medicago truncatula]|uniref:Uncharacterized protein n=1 Tax=Medicago truncatula TaxID=3880 RepID=A0A396H579_MEDTR|nr:hypothetical protein MtrunA17_Chr7g0255381 [Medicago truncatula]
MYICLILTKDWNYSTRQERVGFNFLIVFESILSRIMQCNLGVEKMRYQMSL